MNTGLKGKVVLITGSSGGIGSEMVKLFGAEGAKVAIHYFKNKHTAEKLSREVPESVLVQGDVSEESDVARIFKEIEASLGPVDCFIGNSGIWEEKVAPIHEMSLAQWQHTQKTNLTSLFLCLRSFFQSVKKHQTEKPSAVLIGSTAGIYGEAGHCDYAASKSGAIYGLMLSLKNELTQIAKRGRINAVCPGWVYTPMAEVLKQEPTVAIKALQTIALRKIASADDVAKATLFLASSELSGHLSGTILPVSGGMEGRLLYQPGEIDVHDAGIG